MANYHEYPIGEDGNRGTWNAAIASLPGAHILQTWEWGRIKEQTGWKMLPRFWLDRDGNVRAAAMVLKRVVRLGGFAYQPTILYAPRGPLLDWSDEPLREQVLDDLQNLAKQQRAIFIKIDPEVVVGQGIPGTVDAVENPLGCKLIEKLKQRAWRSSTEQVQFRNSVWLDLTQGEEELLRGMKQKFRYNLRLAERKGVRVRIGNDTDWGCLYQMYAETAVRDGFVIRPEAYYLQVWRTFRDNGLMIPLLAECEGKVIAGLLLFYFGRRAWYLYGMSTQNNRDKMPNHLLQWEAIRQARQKGCEVYDLWGAPDVFDESDTMWGVYKFKEGLGGNTIRTVGALDYPTWGFGYDLYTRLLPRVLDVMRRRGKERVRREVVG